ncbi:putative periplasmic protein [Salmonella enterica subsp. enterica]|uniref:Putative periplasmic protein n=1 Tax=Salmonella enterica I TaxID=59201 RepID=A0A447PD60_SALET|nr:putative periplasmic protein [Salmonella enterica subsp. enterica]
MSRLSCCFVVALRLIHDSTQAVKQFYTSWMTTFTNDVNTPDDTTALMQRYVAKEVIHRLALIQSLYEQEIVGADYFMYAQDYAPDVDSTVTGWEGTSFPRWRKSGCSVGYRVNAHPLGSYTRWEEDAGKFTAFGMLIRVMNSRFMTQAPSPRLRPGQQKSAPEYKKH